MILPSATIYFSTHPGLGVGASGAAVLNVAGEVVAVVRGAVEDDAGQVVAVPLNRQ